MPEIPAELFAAVIDAIERRVEENYREVDGNPLRVNPQAVAVIAAPAALVAIEEQRYAIVPATAPQPSETPQDAQTGDGGISGRSDTYNASTGLSAPHVDDLGGEPA